MKDEKLNQEIDKLEKVIWAWAKIATNTWKRNPTASSPFYLMAGVKQGIKNLIKTGKIDSESLSFDNLLTPKKPTPVEEGK